MRINVSAGHNPDGKKACGAVGLLKESTEARRVAQEVIRLLKLEGHIVYDCTCNDGFSVSDVLSKIVSACNAHTVDLDVAIHLNSGARDITGNGRSTGTEVLVFSKSSKSLEYAIRTCERIASLGFKNRGVKERPDLYYLRKTKAPAMLIECCFVDDRDDAYLFDYKKMAIAIVCGILGKTSLVSDECPYRDSGDILKLRKPLQTGESVKWLQWHLNKILNASLKVDGILGTKTEMWLKSLQSRAGITVDGICGKNTRNAIKIMLGE